MTADPVEPEGPEGPVGDPPPVALHADEPIINDATITVSIRNRVMRA